MHLLTLPLLRQTIDPYRLCAPKNKITKAVIYPEMILGPNASLFGTLLWTGERGKEGDWAGGGGRGGGGVTK